MEKPKLSIRILQIILLLIVTFSGAEAQQKSHNHKAMMQKDSASIIKEFQHIEDKATREYLIKLNLDMIDKTKPTYKTWNKVCPVLGRAVNPKLKPIEYRGKAYGFCCAVCPPKFTENPEKYAGNLNKTGQKFVGNVFK